MPNPVIPDWPAPTHVMASSFTRHGGHSTGPYQGFNCATHVGDRAEHVERNRIELIQQAKLPNQPLWLQQVHGNRMVNASATPYPTTPQADGSYASTPHRVCAVLTADCIPVLMCHRLQPWVAAVHAGWRGLANGILAQACAKAPDIAGLLVWLGPAIGPQSYVVDPSIGEHFSPSERAASLQQNGAQWTMDLYALARHQLTACGVCLLYTSPSPRDGLLSRMPSSA